MSAVSYPRFYRRGTTLVFTLLCLLTLASCQSISSKHVKKDPRGQNGQTDARVSKDTAQRGAHGAGNEQDRAVVTAIQQLIVDSGLTLVGRSRLSVLGRQFTLDCTGTVLAAYWGAGMDPGRYFGGYQGNGVRRMHDMGDEHGMVYMSMKPAVGDVIIWDDTYDMDKNGRWGDPYTHAGIVMEVRDDGQITFLHYNYARGIVLEQMNLQRPDIHLDADGTLVNSPLRLRADRWIRPDAWLASHLVRGFVPLYQYPAIVQSLVADRSTK